MIFTKEDWIVDMEHDDEKLENEDKIGPDETRHFI